jgi:hypothetical protein
MRGFVTNPFVQVERTIVDWFEANGFTVTERNGEWLFETDDFEFSITELASAVARATTPQNA